MANTLKNLTSSYTILITIFFFLSFATSETQGFSKSLSSSEHGSKREKLSHLHFYFHDIVSGKSPAAVRVAQASSTNTSKTGFGAIVVIDDPLTAGPELGSKLVGKAQGIYVSASQTELGFVMASNFVFVEGEFNGSTLSVVGLNNAQSAVRELPIVGGTGLFRFARGYAQLSTHKLDFKTGDATMEYNVFVFHH